MNPKAPFTQADLEELHTELLSRADRVVPMRDVFKGDTGARTIGLRHDVDDNSGSLLTALRMAEWEFERGYSSTYFLLHDSWYWDKEWLEVVPAFEELGHEVGIHVNAIAEGLRQRRDPHEILATAIGELRARGVHVYGCVAHGDALCHGKDGLVFANDEMFTESRRPDVGRPDRAVMADGCVWHIEPVSRTVYGLEYDANWLSRGDYISDSGGKWSQPFEGVVKRFGQGQLHVLIHPDWWREAFVSAQVAA